ncbi:MAG: NAD(P)-dependent oxidoreductase [Alphaproteobacteria bacterium]|nr:MAG: NAD(P)-dependent oxidoreductase [Alphaproteobacteria bacterium]TAF75299.1 MAG: NAD(P)-dependent oxidoreductase [Alphaproteobacteria bacterium]
MQKFYETPQNYPETRPASQRKADFDEIYQQFADEKAQQQSERCLQCGVPFCQVHCPLHNNIPDWLRYTAEGRLRDAYEMAASTNNFPEICGRICPQDRLCEGNCVVQSGFGAITIGSIEQYVTDKAWEQGWITPFMPPSERAQSVGIIGSGPAGMAAAQQMREAGYQVHLYDRYPTAGGLMMHGIPNFKLDKTIVTRRVEQYQQSGVVFHQGVDIGTTMSFAQLRGQHDALLIATGVYRARGLDLEGEHKENVVKALDFLTQHNKGIFESSEVEARLSAAGKIVMVIGGGDTAMDCVRTAIRQGAKRVMCVYRRDKKNMPGSQREVKNAEDEGVEFRWLSVPVRFYGAQRVEAVDVQAMRLGAPDRSGRSSPTPIEGEVAQLSVDMVITALGFEPEALPTLFAEPQLRVSKAGTLQVDKQMMTSLHGVFAAGDIVRGASLVVWAIADGRDVAQHMMHFMEQQRECAA